MNIIASVIIWIIGLISLYYVIFWSLIYLQGGSKSPKKIKILKYPFITIAIPAYNEEKHIQKTIESALSIDYPKDSFEVIIINDGSKDNTYKIAKETLKKYSSFNTTLINKKNEGKGAALNNALKIAKGKYFTCLDADSYIEPSAPKKMVCYFASDKIAAVLPYMKVSNPKNLLQKLQWYEYIVNMYYKKLMGHLDCVHVAPGPFSMYKTDIIKKIGMFEEDNLTEDLEITLRLQKNNYRIIQLLDVVVYTNVPKTIKAFYNQRNRWFKGALLNSIRYRFMMFNPKFGDFAFIQFPLVFFSGLLSLVLLSTTVYYSLSPKITFLSNLQYVHFDIINYFSNMHFAFNLIDLNFSFLLLSFFMMILSVISLYLSFSYTKEKIFKYGVIPVFIFMFYYFIHLGIVWAGIMFDLARGKIQRW